MFKTIVLFALLTVVVVITECRANIIPYGISQSVAADAADAVGVAAPAVPADKPDLDNVERQCLLLAAYGLGVKLEVIAPGKSVCLPAGGIIPLKW